MKTCRRCKVKLRPDEFVRYRGIVLCLTCFAEAKMMVNILYHGEGGFRGPPKRREWT
ncbi:unnamed protein product [marine sediment metagenome]|uniref:Uncharacterized protein n=1 Tax=marine sediment metagenome TaxID=412755 RepID=X0TG92_9ZZZZ